MIKLKLIDTREAGDILGIHYSRVRTLVKQGHLKDYNEVNPKAKKHYTKLSVTDVRELKKTHFIGKRTVQPKHVESNGHALVRVPEKIEVLQKIEASPIRSITDRLTAIEDKLDILLKLWA